MMTPERFEALASAYGGDLRRWPEDEREAAQAFAERRPEAQAILARERRLDELLDRAATPRATPELVARFAQAPRRRFGFVAQLAGLAAAAALGLFVGWSAPLDSAGDDPWDTVALGDWDEG